MKSTVAVFFLVVSLLIGISPLQAKAQKKRKTSQPVQQRGPLKICQGVPLPDNYVIVAYETSSLCPHGAYVLKRLDASDASTTKGASHLPQKTAQSSTLTASAVSRPRKVRNGQTSPAINELSDANVTLDPVQPQLIAAPNTAATSSAGSDGSKGAELAKDLTPTRNDKPGDKSGEEVSEGDVVRIDTNFVTVPVSVFDRQGRFVPNLRREDFRVFDNGVEQKVAYFEPTETPFTVALLLDTSGSTTFHLSEIKDAAIAFAKKLRPQDRVLVVTFNERVMLLTEATNDLDAVTEVIQQNANTGFSTRLYDAIDLVIKERLNKIKGRKAIVLFTDGVDTASYLATYRSTLREAEELDALIYPIQYDTTDFIAASQAAGNVTIVTSTRSIWPYPGRTSSRVIYGTSGSSLPLPGSTLADYKTAGRYLNELADKTGARLYQANDRRQLHEAFSQIAEELRRQYSLGYYPETSTQEGERRTIKVQLDQTDLAVRARASYIQKVAPAKR
jgi:VWFA-related protein